MPGCYLLVRWIFLRGLSLIYLSAFLSIFLQLDGLLGSKGILPASDLLKQVHLASNEINWFDLPTIFWLADSDLFLNAICILGILLSLLLLIGIAEKLTAAFLFSFYLSFVSIGQIFFSFQWDVLLLETGFLAILIAPMNLRPQILSSTAPAQSTVLLFRFLLFRLMFSSGVVKLLSRDVTWGKLTALNFHYLTQPLPTALAWYADKLPEIVQKTSVASMFIIELILPFFIFSRLGLRLFAGAAFVTFQLLILLTGNYTFFNLLTILLCVFLLDDQHVACFFPKRVTDQLISYPPSAIKKVSFNFWLVILPLTILGTSQLVTTIAGTRILPGPVVAGMQLAEPFRIVNRYGLFASMTTTRNEIVVEGSKDGKDWYEYQFKYKPGQLDRPPRFNIPHQPRLDWQMWFAALSSIDRSPWLLNLAEALLENREPVLKLLDNPSPDSPPRYLRFSYYNYRFTTAEEKKATGQWWHRQRLGLYAGPIESKN